MKVSTWNSCYRDTWSGLIVPEAFSHPAKFSPGLIKRIFEHCLDMGYLAKDQTIVDPFGGIGGGGVMAAPMGLKWIGVELEEKFVDLAQQNFALHARAWDIMGYPQPVILQGDSRRLSSVLQEAVLICTSPPFETSLTSKDEKFNAIARPGRTDQNSDYGHTPGQIGNLKSGDLEAVIDGCVMSPPYAESMEKTGGIDPDKSKHMGGPHSQMNNSDTRYGSSPGQIGNLKSGNLKDVLDISQETDSIDKDTQVLPNNQISNPGLSDASRPNKANLGISSDEAFFLGEAQCHQNKNAKIVENLSREMENTKDVSLVQAKKLVISKTIDSTGLIFQCQRLPGKEITTGRGEVLIGEGQDGLKKEERHSNETNISVNVEKSKDCGFTTLNQQKKQEENGTIPLITLKPSAIAAMPKSTNLEENNQLKLNVESVEKNLSAGPVMVHFVPLNVDEQDGEKKPDANHHNKIMKSGDISAIISSPPYAESLHGNEITIDEARLERMKKEGFVNRRDHGFLRGKASVSQSGNYSPNPSNIGNMKAGDVEAVVTSPPYESTSVIGCDQIAPWIREEYKKTGKWPKGDLKLHGKGSDYIGSAGQIGQTSGESYWQAVADVYRECFKILKPSGVIIIVVKSYIKAGRRVPLPMQTLKLLIHLGFVPLERIKAMLVEETVTQGLFGDIVKVTERKSFFRRLHEKKYPNLKINFEEILVCKKT